MTWQAMELAIYTTRGCLTWKNRKVEKRRSDNCDFPTARTVSTRQRSLNIVQMQVTMPPQITGGKLTILSLQHPFAERKLVA
jgi:hypothetical protein